MMVEQRSQIVFEQAGLGSVLKANNLAVPPNQREYAWTDKQVTQLFRDYSRAINNGSYFLGTIVTIPRGEGLEVVDGQQRLATTAILLAAIRDHLAGKEEIIVESINNEFLTGIVRARRARVSKLRLNVDDAELFNWIVTQEKGQQPDVTRRSHELLLDAYAEARRHVTAIVSALDPKDHGDVLNSWVSFIEHQALVVLLKVPNDADAYRMFETLNDRGLKTSQADLIKNYLFGRADQRIHEVQTKWAYMRGALETLDDDEITVTFLRHALIVQKGHLTESAVYDAVQESVKSEAGALTFVATLESLASSYVATFNGEHERWNGYPDAARRAIEVFNLLNIKPLRPLLLAVTSKMQPKEAAQSLQFLVSLGVRLMIASSTRSGSVEEPLAEAAKRVYDGKITNKDDLRKELTVTPSDAVFRDALANARVSNAKLARYYLRSLEMAAKEEPEPWFIPQDDRSIINLEHVLPQRPDGNWPQFDDDAVSVYSKRLGNLSLMRALDNSGLKSESFEEKKQVYAVCPYVLTSQIAECDEWTVDRIVERQKVLADLGIAAWPI